MPWLSHLFPEFYMKQYHYVGHTFSKSEQNQFLTNPPVTSTQCIYNTIRTQSQYTSYTPQYARKGTHKPECGANSSNSSLRHIYDNILTLVHTNQSVDNIQQQLTLVHTNQSVDNIQQQLTLVHTNTNIKCNILYIHVYNIHTHTINPECGDTQQLLRDSGVEILLATTHSGTHKPERG